MVAIYKIRLPDELAELIRGAVGRDAVICLFIE